MLKQKPFTVESVAELLLGYGYLDADSLVDIHSREPQIRQQIENRQGNGAHSFGSQKYLALPPEVIAEMEIQALHDPDQLITEDLIYELVARQEGMRYVKIDPLKLDSRIVTGYFSRPFARRSNAVPLDEKDGELFVAIADPYDAELLENLNRICGKRIVPVLSVRKDIQRVITEVYGFKKSVSDAEASIDGTIDLFNLEQFFQMQNIDEIEDNDRHIVNAVDYLLHYAFEQRASDIHIEPKREHSIIRLRIDGVLHNIHYLPQKIHAPMVSRIKAMSRLDIAERRKPQDGRMKMGLDEREIEIRISTVPCAFGEKAVLRVLDSESMLKDIGQLGFDSEKEKQYRQLVTQPTGMVLVTGPTGSGKTTTLYSTLNALATQAVNITTIEDPIEMVLEPFNQIAVQRRIDLDFASALKYILRQDPDIIMVGEIRDKETADNAVQAALTGHLVLSTLHTNNSVSTIARLLELGVKSYLISTTLNMVLAQRLVRMICPICKQESVLSEDEMESLGIKVPGENQKLKSWFGEGCVKCRYTGLFGRTGIFEMFEINDKIRRLIKKQADSREMFKVARQDGMSTLREEAIKKLASGKTSYGEIMRVLAL